MRTLIDDLLSFSRTSVDNTKLEHTDLKILLDSVIDNLSDRIATSGTVIHADALCATEVVPFQIGQLFQNLIENAIKFSTKNVSTILHITTHKLGGSALKIQGLIADKLYYEISFSDNGIGFKAEYSEQIFEVFQRLHAKSEYEGTGIGLAIAKKIAENHGGAITAEGNLGSGATFRVYLPA